jgi:hypothetical protein
MTCAQVWDGDEMLIICTKGAIVPLMKCEWSHQMLATWRYRMSIVNKDSILQQR